MHGPGSAKGNGLDAKGVRGAANLDGHGAGSFRDFDVAPTAAVASGFESCKYETSSVGEPGSSQRLHGLPCGADPAMANHGSRQLQDGRWGRSGSRDSALC